MSANIPLFVFFDFDGVIADSFQAAFRAHRSIFPKMDELEYRGILEKNVNDWNWKEKLRAAGQPEDIDFFERYLPEFEKQAGLFSGMDRVVRNLSRSYQLIVVSSSLTGAIQDFLERHDLADDFRQIMGNDIHHSKVEKFKMAFDRYGFGPDRSVMITDTLGDVREANQAKVGVIGVTWGFHRPEQLRQGDCFRIVDQPSEIEPAVDDYFKNP